MKRHLIVILILAVFLALMAPFIAPAPSQAAGGPTNAYYGNISYTVKHGDTLASIARTYCTNWHTIYNMNSHIIGPNPNHLVPGTVLTVPAQCNGSGCYDRGVLPHAQGTVYPPNTYWVIRGDTWYSIGKRFGVSVAALRQANNRYYPHAYSYAVIPCASVVPPQQPPTPIPPTPQPPVAESYLTISSPPANATLTTTTFTVAGRGGKLHEANVVVRIKDTNGAVLAEQTTVLQGPNVGTGGEGDWSIQFNLSNPPADAVIEATSPGSSAHASITVHFQVNGPIDYQPGQCNINVRAGTSVYETPAGKVLGLFQTPTTVGAQRREFHNNEYWYRIAIPISPGTGWVPDSQLDGKSPGC